MRHAEVDIAFSQIAVFTIERLHRPNTALRLVLDEENATLHSEAEPLSDGTTATIRELGGDFVVLADSIDHPPTNAKLRLIVDGHERRRTVWLVQGRKAGQFQVDIAPSPNASN